VSARLPLLASVLLCFGALGRAQEISIEKAEGQPGFTIENDTVTDLSGLTWTGGDSFYAVADHPNLLVPLTLKIDRATGCIARGEFGTPIPVRAPISDFEGVTYVGSTKTFYISGENGHGVISFQPGGSAQIQPVPGIFAEARKNLSLEGITWNDIAGCFWIANEEALNPDGPVSGTTGTLVRLQQFDAKFRPVAQYAYRTEPTAFRFRGSGNGVSDLCLLPDGRLIVLERGFVFGSLQVRLFLADFKGATDTSKLHSLVGAEFEPMRKTLLFEEATGFTNFEGIALGPMLDDGSRSLILIADSNGGKTHAFLPLKLRLNGQGSKATPAPARTSSSRSTPPL
jgi:hypothetical protein